MADEFTRSVESNSTRTTDWNISYSVSRGVERTKYSNESRAEIF